MVTTMTNQQMMFFMKRASASGMPFLLRRALSGQSPSCASCKSKGVTVDKNQFKSDQEICNNESHHYAQVQCTNIPPLCPPTKIGS